MNGPRARLCIILVALFLAGSSGSIFGEEAPATAELRWLGLSKQLDADDQKELCVQLAGIVESSNMNSTQKKFGYLMNADAYRRMGTGDCLTVSFPTPRVIKTAGGNVMVAKALFWLDGPGGDTCLFTIDETGGVVGHGKYSGVLCEKLKETVKAFLSK